MRGRARRWLARAWAAPCSFIGLTLGLALCLAGGRPRVVAGVLEVSLRPDHARCGSLLRRLPFRAITFGHVVLAVTAMDQPRYRRHERVHVRQYEAWGPLFLPAYAASSAWQWLRGRDPYRDNRFEVDARRRSGDAA